MCCDGFYASMADEMETKGADEVEKLKSKFMSAWNNVKYSKFYFANKVWVVFITLMVCIGCEGTGEAKKITMLVFPLRLGFKNKDFLQPQFSSFPAWKMLSL